tara:strand:+ start:38691 stop:40193 length:1503 start_codon:yes stop_codon:yes gene_type:complete
MGGIFAPAMVLAQDGQNSMLYSSLAQQFIGFNVNGDANANILPSVATQNGFGSYLDNPASMGLINMSYFNTGLLTNLTEQNNSYLGSSSSYDNLNTKFGNIGLIYAVPTNQGSLVVGGGYTLNNQINRTNTLGVFNTRSSITDAFKNENSDYYNIAFETYAIDYEDVEETSLESIFRIGFAPGEYLGIQQNAEIKQRGSLGEYSIFAAMEIQRNLFVGASLGLVYGTYSYERNFLEWDSEESYNGEFIPTVDGDTDIYDILVEDRYNSEIVGANINAGILYKIHSNFNLGASIKIPSKMMITEEYNSSISTSLDNEAPSFFDEFDGDYSYSVQNPGQLNLGAAIENIGGFTVSVSSEIIDYRNTSIDLTRDSELSFRDVAFLREQEAVFDSLISSDYKLVNNLKAGLKFKSKTGFELRGGLGFLPGKSTKYSADKIVLSGGFGIPLSRELYMDITTQYTGWNDRSILYGYIDSQTGQERFESIDETITHINVTVGIKYRF